MYHRDAVCCYRGGLFTLYLQQYKICEVKQGKMSSTEIALINLYLQAGYVFLTLVLAGAAIWSIRRTSNQSQAALDIAHEQIEQSKRQAQQERFAANHPLLVPEREPKFQSDHPSWLEWSENEQAIGIHNMGLGVALNVASVIYGCESYLTDWTTNKRSSHAEDIHWTCWLGLPIASGRVENAIHKLGNGMFYENNKHIGKHTFNAPPEPRVNPNQDQPFIIARISITCYDIFRRKHASIFDYVQHTHGWQLVEFLEDIKEDLSDLEG